MEYFDPIAPQKRRPTLVTVLAVLTFIGSGLNFLVFFFLSLSSDIIPAMIEAVENIGMPDEYIQIYMDMANIQNWQFLLMALSYGIAIFGATLMLKMKKMGYHFYIASQILIFCLSNFLLGGPFKMGIMGVIGSLLFILLYGLNYKQMEPKKEEESDENPNKWGEY